jgi:hypothetical protein
MPSMSTVPRWLSGEQATRATTALEAQGWRAEAVMLTVGEYVVELRDLAVRGHPKLATFRQAGEAEAWLHRRGHGLRARVPGVDFLQGKWQVRAPAGTGA